MNLSVSQLAHKDTDKLVSTIKTVGINQIESVFTLIKPWDALNLSDVATLNTKLSANSIRVSSAQSLFYGLPFTLDQTEECLKHMQRVIMYSRVLGLKTLVFGSPNMRKHTNNLSAFFQGVDELLTETGIQLVIEPNCKAYGGDYFHTVPEIVDYLESKSFRNIATMIDYHNVLAENMSPSKLLEEYIEKVWHIHVSEPKLKPIQNILEHKEFADSIKATNYDGVITYELLQSDLDDASVLNSITIFKQLYGEH